LQTGRRNSLSTGGTGLGAGVLQGPFLQTGRRKSSPASVASTGFRFGLPKGWRRKEKKPCFSSGAPLLAALLFGGAPGLLAGREAGTLTRDGAELCELALAPRLPVECEVPAVPWLLALE
jgi:hypothetical protein